MSSLLCRFINCFFHIHLHQSSAMHKFDIHMCAWMCTYLKTISLHVHFARVLICGFLQVPFPNLMMTCFYVRPLIVGADVLEWKEYEVRMCITNNSVTDTYKSLWIVLLMRLKCYMPPGSMFSSCIFVLFCSCHLNSRLDSNGSAITKPLYCATSD